ncbi:hypothetical protein [Bacillus sp. CH30_1T]|nr:hypothetical protein [Bacillus sp. CH30_1T]
MASEMPNIGMGGTAGNEFPFEFLLAALLIIASGTTLGMKKYATHKK